MKNRVRLRKATEQYFENLDANAVAEENELAKDLVSAAKGIDFDEDPVAGEQ